MLTEQNEPQVDLTVPPKPEAKSHPPTMMRPEDDVSEDDVPGKEEAPGEAHKVAADAPAAQSAEEKSDVVAEVMKRRDARELAAIVREKKAMESERAKYKEHEAKLAALARIDRLLEDGDDAGAIEELLALKHGDKASARLPETYNALTARVLESQTAKQPVSRAERGVSRLERELEEVKAREAQTRARLEEREAEEYERSVRGAKATLSKFLQDNQTSYEALLLEADAPEEIVWEILDEHEKLKKPITLGEAAELANQHFKPAFQRKAERYNQIKNSPAPKKANEVPTKLEAPTSKSAPPRKSLTNADASAVAATKAMPPAKNDEERISRGWQILRRGSGQ